MAHTHSVPAYIDMRPRLASNYLEPVSSRNQVDMYSEWREVLKSILLTEDQLTLTESLGEGMYYMYTTIISFGIMHLCVSVPCKHCSCI